MIKVSINNICAKLVECEPLTSGMIGKTLDVEFSAHWNAYEKTAVFSNGDITIDVLESQWNGNTITIPHEVLAVSNRTIMFGVYGFGVENGAVHALPTIYAKIGIPMVGADPTSDPTTDPSLPVYAQLQWQIDHFEISPEQIAEQIQEYIEAHPLEIPTASATVLGGVKIGNGLSVTSDGTLSADITEDDVSDAVNTALEAAKESGEFDGADGKSAYEIAVEQGYVGTETEWLNSLRGADGEDGADGITPHIGANGNWYIGNTDTGNPSRGEAGQNGVDGEDGYTPVKGVDYFTDADKAEIAAAATEEIDLSDYALKDDLGELSDLDTEDKSSIVAAINEVAAGGSGVTSAMSESLWALLEKAEYVTAPTDAELTAFKAAWGLKYLASISAVYSGDNVPAGTNVEELRSDLTVTANYSDGTTETVTDYLLAGVLYEGENTITVTYQLKTTTFTVTAEVGKLYLYKDGALDTDVTGGFMGTTGWQFSYNGIHWTQPAYAAEINYGTDSFDVTTQGGSQYHYRTTKKIDITNYSSVHILAYAEYDPNNVVTELPHDRSMDSENCVVYAITDGDNLLNCDKAVSYHGTETVIDVSDLTGEYYFLSVQRESFYRTIKQTVSAIWLE